MSKTPKSETSSRRDFLKLAATSAPPEGPPPLARQAVNYSAAVARWVAAGRPTRSPERIAQVLEICRACPAYRSSGGRPQCGYCGCSINSSRDGVRNKIAMATEVCPHPQGPKWGAEGVPE